MTITREREMIVVVVTRMGTTITNFSARTIKGGMIGNNLVQGMITIYDTRALLLFGSGSMHSYISYRLARRIGMTITRERLMIIVVVTRMRTTKSTFSPTL